jgi:hypothetical protein
MAAAEHGKASSLHTLSRASKTGAKIADLGPASMYIPLLLGSCETTFNMSFAGRLFTDGLGHQTQETWTKNDKETPECI